MTLSIDLSTFPALCQRLPPGIALDYCMNIHPEGRIGFRIPHPGLLVRWKAPGERLPAGIITDHPHCIF